MSKDRADNQALLVYLLLPTLFLTVALLGGVRVAAGTGALVFVAPPLVTLILAAMLLALFVKGGAVRAAEWLSGDNPPLANLSHALTLAALFFASAQAFNSVLPERGLLRWVFSFFFLWTLWQDLFTPFDARRLLRSLAALFGTAFVLKHLLLASLHAPEGGWLARLTGLALEGLTLGALAGEPFAPASGYVSFFALALYVLGLYLLPPAPRLGDETDTARAGGLVETLRRLPPAERAAVRRALAADDAPEADAVVLDAQLEDAAQDPEATVVRKR
jgi:hypothetical protein